MAANVPTRLGQTSLEKLKDILRHDNKVKVAGRVIMYAQPDPH